MKRLSSSSQSFVRYGSILFLLAMILASFSRQQNLSLYLPKNSIKTEKITQSLIKNVNLHNTSSSSSSSSISTSSTTTSHFDASNNQDNFNHHGHPRMVSSNTTKQQQQHHHHHHNSKVLFNISIVVQLSGELGNHLSKVGFGYAVQNLLKERHNISSHLILQHQERGSKWEIARNDLKQCFPSFFRRYDFTLGNTPEFYSLQKKQQRMIGENHEMFVFPTSISLQDTIQKIDTIADFLLMNISSNTTTITNMIDQYDKNSTTSAAVIDQKNNNISFPFIHVQEFINYDLLDRYYNQIQDIFVFDHDACCAEIPYEDEAVFHFRNFVGEMPRRGKRKGYEELNPNQTVDELFGHLPSGSKIAMTTRSYHNSQNNDPIVQEYATAFERRGFQWRVIANQSGIQDFCFLMSTKYELAGIARSTFVQWAVFLRGGNSNNKETTNRNTSWLYSINSNDTRNALGDAALIQYNWTYHPELQDQIRFVHFSAQ